MRSWKAAFQLATFVASLVAIAACGTTFVPAPNVTPSPIYTGQPSATPAPTTSLGPLPTGPAAEIEVLVTGGEFDGSYRAVAINGCANDPAQNSFAVSYANDFAADDFVALELVLRNATQAQEDATSDFSLDIGLGGAGGGISYSLDPAEANGEGEAFLDVTDSDATIDLSVITPDETIIDLTVICELV